MGKKHTPETIEKIKATRDYNMGRRSVSTPLGIFVSINAAARAHGCTAANIYVKLKRARDGYSYLEIA
jgi:transposase-like protein